MDRFLQLISSWNTSCLDDHIPATLHRVAAACPVHPRRSCGQCISLLPLPCGLVPASALCLKPVPTPISVLSGDYCTGIFKKNQKFPECEDLFTQVFCHLSGVAMPVRIA
jgi:hypothetical protein